MLTFKRSLSNREYILINVLKSLASVISMCSLHIILLSTITPSYFTRFAEQNAVGRVIYPRSGPTENTVCITFSIVV
jgi:hypothetical protein